WMFSTTVVLNPCQARNDSGSLTPSLTGLVTPGRPPGVGRRGATAAVPPLRPGEGPTGHRPRAPPRVPDQAGVGRRVAPVGQEMAGAAGQAALGRRRRGLRQGRLPQAGASVGDDDRQPTPQGLGPAHGPRTPTVGASWPAPDVWRTPHRPGQARGPATWMVDR